MKGDVIWLPADSPLVGIHKPCGETTAAIILANWAQTRKYLSKKKLSRGYHKVTAPPPGWNKGKGKGSGKGRSRKGNGKFSKYRKVIRSHTWVQGLRKMTSKPRRDPAGTTSNANKE